jgi:predicted XRE-type DNA-binding protein
LKYNKLIPCNCNSCQVHNEVFDNEPHFYKYANLMNRMNNNIYEVECDKSFKKVDILELIDDILIVDHDLKDRGKDMKDKDREGGGINIHGDVGQIVNQYGDNSKASFIQNNVTQMHEVIEKSAGLSTEDKESIKADIVTILTDMIEENQIPQKKLANVVIKEPKLKKLFMGLIGGTSGSLLAKGIIELVQKVLENPTVFK